MVFHYSAHLLDSHFYALLMFDFFDHSFSSYNRYVVLHHSCHSTLDCLYDFLALCLFYSLLYTLSRLTLGFFH